MRARKNGLSRKRWLITFISMGALLSNGGCVSRDEERIEQKKLALVQVVSGRPQSPTAAFPQRTPLRSNVRQTSDSGTLKDASILSDAGSVDSALDAGLLASSFSFSLSMSCLPDSDVLDSADKALKEWKSMRETELQQVTGIRDRNGVQRLQLGIPYYLTSIPYSSVSSDVSAVEVEIKDMYSWIFPIVSEGKYISLLRMVEQHGEWNMVSIGGAEGAMKLQKIEEEIGVYHEDIFRVIVRQYQQGKDYLNYVSNDKKLKEGDFYRFYDGLNNVSDNKMIFEDIINEIRNNLNPNIDLMFN